MIIKKYCQIYMHKTFENNIFTNSKFWVRKCMFITYSYTKEKQWRDDFLKMLLFNCYSEVMRSLGTKFQQKSIIFFSKPEEFVSQ